MLKLMWVGNGECVYTLGICYSPYVWLQRAGVTLWPHLFR